MAESEIEEAIEEVASDDLLEDESNDESNPEEVKNKWLTKPMIIKIAIGVSVLLIGAGVATYFLLMSDDPVVDEESLIEQVDEPVNESEDMTDAATNSETEAEAGIDMDSLIEQPNSAPPADSEMPVESEQGDATIESAEKPANEKLSDEEKMLKMREEAVSLQEENLRLKQKLMGADPSETMPVEDSEKAKRDSSISVQDVNQYMDLYQDNLETYPSVRKPKAEPVPDPKWGE
mgnify:CR=1 FL=1